MFKFICKAVIPLTLFLVALAVGQNGPFKHIIIIVQENRTPDNLFGSNPSIGNCGQEHPFETGVDIVDGGYYYYDSNNTKVQVPICNMPLPLNGWDAAVNDIVDPNHKYEDWGTDYDNGNMDGFCTGEQYGPPACPEYSYVQASDVKPYFQIAQAYGFANYMFQSNEGPSLEGHLFLFAGTSAPVAPWDTTDKDGYGFLDQYDYLADVPGGNKPYGCPDTGGYPEWVAPTGETEQSVTQTQCYTHDTLVTAQSQCSNGGPDYCDRGLDSLPSYMVWGYYVEPNSIVDGQGGYSYWDAPAFAPEVCYGQNNPYNSNWCGPGPSGNSKEWSDHVRSPRGPIPYGPPHTYSYAPVLDDIAACQLPAISWVIPDGAYSDHPRSVKQADAPAVGPDWVGDIVNAVGNSLQNNCGIDYWGYNTPQNATAEPTAIFVVWDDWGGWFDHVQPPPGLVRVDNPNPPPGYYSCDPTKGQWGCGYTDGLRVPLLVVSEYTPAGTVSGACGNGTQNPTCPNFGPAGDLTQYVHDFGSILRYTEVNFGMSYIDSYDTWQYADRNAPDNQNGNVPLSEFFTGPGRQFTSITTYTDDQCFQTHTGSKCPKGLLAGSWVASDPDSY
jgi:hypothetical protein